MKKKRIEDVDPNFKQAALDDKGIIWRSAAQDVFTVRGLGWFEENGRGFCRLPNRAKEIVRPDVWFLAQAPSGARVCFRTDSTVLAVRFKNTQPCNMIHCATTGSDGVFVYEGEPMLERPWNMAAPPLGQKECEKVIAEGLSRQMRVFTVYLPLYASFAGIEIGLDPKAKLAPPPACRFAKPVVFYGTSITQGGCSSTAGGDFISAIGRRLNIDVINLGFSGNGRGEPEVARLIAELDAAAFLLDYCANTTPEGLDATLPGFIGILREKHPETPIICVSKIHFYRELYNPATRAEVEAQRDIMIKHYSARRAMGDANIHFIDGWSLVGAGEDFAHVDGVHPTSLGFAIMAERLILPLRHVLRF